MKRPADDTHDATKRLKTLTHPFRTHSADPNKKRTLSDDTPDASIKRQRSNQVEESKQSQTATSNLDLTDEATTIPGDETEPFDDISIRIHLDEQAKSQHIIARNKHQVNDETRSKTPAFEAMKTRTTTPAAMFEDMEGKTTCNTQDSKTAASLTSDGYLYSLNHNERLSGSQENPNKAIKSTSSRSHENRRVMFSTATTYLFEWDAACRRPTLARRHVRQNTKTLKSVKFSTATTHHVCV
ncbi:hypothetical protein AC1031_017127 [Aphanomyces cochlioides]|nr:hypothetical protein AC1031_017127 [Aphanomyces cochlioides]